MNARDLPLSEAWPRLVRKAMLHVASLARWAMVNVYATSDHDSVSKTDLIEYKATVVFMVVILPASLFRFVIFRSFIPQPSVGIQTGAIRPALGRAHPNWQLRL